MIVLPFQGVFVNSKWLWSSFPQYIFLPKCPSNMLCFDNLWLSTICKDLFLCYRLILISPWFITMHLTCHWQKRCWGLSLQIIKKEAVLFLKFYFKIRRWRKRRQRVAVRGSVAHVYCCRGVLDTETFQTGFTYRHTMPLPSQRGDHIEWCTHFTLKST